MSISEQVKELRKYCTELKKLGGWWSDHLARKVSEAADTIESLSAKLQAADEELERWHADRINENIKNPFAQTSTLICHNCDHKDEYIEELEAANMERSAEDCGGWISCKERLPENGQKVFVSRNGETLESVFEFHIPDEEDYEGEYGNTIRGYFFSECDACVGIYSDDTISVAWQPLPEPYHEP